MGAMCAPGRDVKSTLQCISGCSDESLEALRPRFRVGTTAGLQDEPISGALKQKLYLDMEACAVDWVVCPHDANAVAAMLNAGLVDLAMLPSTEAMFLVLGCRSLRICGHFAGPRRLWRVFCLGGTQRIKGGGIRRLGVPEGVSASVLAALVQDKGCFGLSDTIPETIALPSFMEALSWVTAGRVQAVLWDCTSSERQTALTLCDEPMAPVRPPGFSHCFVCGREALASKSATIRQFYSFTNDLCAELRAEGLHKAYMAQLYNFTDVDLEAWLEDPVWTCTSIIDWTTVMQPVDYLARINRLEEDFSLHRHLAPGCRVIGGPAPEPPAMRRPEARGHREDTSTIAEGPRIVPSHGGTAAAEDDEVAAANGLPAARTLRLLPRGAPEDGVAICGSAEELCLRGVSPSPDPKRVPGCPSAAGLRPVPAG